MSIEKAGTPRNDANVVGFSAGSADGRFHDYKALEGSFGESYARQYYGKDRQVPSDEHIVADHLIPFLRQRHGSGICLDPATGPTSHHQLFLSRYFDELHCGDYLSDNREFVGKFVAGAPDALPWDHYAEFYLEKEGRLVSEENVDTLIADTRGKIGPNVLPSNLMTQPVVENGVLYDAVSCFYCLEEVARTPQDFFDVVANAASQLKVGGALMISALAESDFYLLKKPDGSEVTIPCLYVDQDLLIRAMEAAGLTIPAGGVTLKATEDQAKEGLPGILVGYAVKGA